MVKVDPRLMSKLNSTLNNERIKTIATFHLTKKSKDVVDQTLHDTEIATNEKPVDLKYYEKLGLLLLEASPQFIQKLTENSNISTLALARDDDIYGIK